MRAGVLALQGGVRPHLDAFERLGVRAEPVRTAAALARLTHLVLPGGESTAIARLGERLGLWPVLRERFAAGELALFGTCAGAILLGDGEGPPPRLALVDATLERNAYGRQLDSFERELEIDGLGALRGVFIRAPRVTRVGPGVRVLARAGADPVLLDAPGALLATFHPELAGSDALHALFLERSSVRAATGGAA